MRLIDGDALIALVQDSTILGDGFKQAFCALVNGEPTVKPERKTDCAGCKLLKEMYGSDADDEWDDQNE
jgi:hypothetical protein